MKSLRNSVRLIGYLGNDPEVKEFNQMKVANFRMATTDTCKNSKGEKVDETQWHNIAVWGTQADVVEKYLRKGNEVCVEGRLQHREYQTEKGEKRYFTEVNVNDRQVESKEKE